jgi:hypothetical protein
VVNHVIELLIKIKKKYNTTLIYIKR